MSAEIPMERASQSLSTDSNRSGPCLASVLPISGISAVEKQGDSLSPSGFQGEPVLGKTPPYISPPLSTDDTSSIGQTQTTAARIDAEASYTTNPTAPNHLYEVVHQQFEQIQKVLQEQSRLLALLGTGQMFPACVPSWWIGLLPVLPFTNSEKDSYSLAPQLPVFPASSPPSDQRRTEDHVVPKSASQGKNQLLPPEAILTPLLLIHKQNRESHLIPDRFHITEKVHKTLILFKMTKMPFSKRTRSVFHVLVMHLIGFLCSVSTSVLYTHTHTHRHTHTHIITHKYIYMYIYTYIDLEFRQRISQ
ncbi:hypothetical protein EXN66_Car018805 [Channa argus]|uniref:Uncharacterized protein n=1 Tax=Channa argus TaxID=215402 RepID=A0A6G1QKX6_CHAAH|nr:hypothetical protein EXN66_Car018805 [Channa argus]